LSARQRVEYLLAERDQLVIGQQFGHTPDRVAGKAIHDSFDVRFGLGQEEFFQIPHGPVFDLLVLTLVGGLPDQLLQIVHQQWMFIEISDLGVGQKLPGVFSGGLIPGAHTDGEIAFLEIVCGADHLSIERLDRIPLLFVERRQKRPRPS